MPRRTSRIGRRGRNPVRGSWAVAVFQLAENSFPELLQSECVSATQLRIRRVGIFAGWCGKIGRRTRHCGWHIGAVSEHASRAIASGRIRQGVAGRPIPLLLPGRGANRACNRVPGVYFHPTCISPVGRESGTLLRAHLLRPPRREPGSASHGGLGAETVHCSPG